MSSSDSRPPDPSSLTTQQLWREIASLKELTMTLFDGQSGRIDGIEKSIDLSHADLVRVPTDVQKQVGNLKELVDEKLDGLSQRITDEAALRDEKFQGVGKQFEERDVRTKETATANTTTINAALQSQKEAAGEQAKSFTLSVDKSEKVVMDRINQQQTLFETTTRAQSDKVGDLTDRVTRLEGTGKGRTDVWGWLVAGIAVLISLFVALRGRL